LVTQTRLAAGSTATTLGPLPTGRVDVARVAPLITVTVASALLAT
jgi:hypothetical protein